MRIYLSYFYMIRFFPAKLLPVSTTISDPSWYHDFKGHDHVFKDKRGVINGIRYEDLSSLATHNGSCYHCDHSNYENCSFLKDYHNHLYSLDFNQVTSDLSKLSLQLSKVLHTDTDYDICLIVYEAPTNPCSERSVLMDWFKSNDYELLEWSKSLLTS